MALICALLDVFLIILFLRIILSWFPSPGGGLDTVIGLLAVATDWVLVPLRRAVPPVRIGAGALDLSPMIVMVGVIVLKSLLC